MRTKQYSCFENSGVYDEDWTVKIDKRPLVTSAVVLSEAVILLLLIRCCFLFPLCVGGLYLFLYVGCGSQYPF